MPALNLPLAVVVGRQPRDTRPWRDDEIENARAWRAAVPPLTYRDIGQRLGGRSEQSVRLKLYDERMRAVRGGNHAVGWSREERERCGPARIANRDAAMIAACRATGGFTAFSHQQLRGAQWALCRPLIGADGRARPLGWKDGRAVCELRPDEITYLTALRRWWRAQTQPLSPCGRGRGPAPSAAKSVGG